MYPTACQCPPRCVKSPRRCFILGICIRCKAPHLGKRSTLDSKNNHPVISSGLQIDLLDELDLAGLKNNMELTKSTQNTAEDLSHETFELKRSGPSENQASDSNNDESGILNCNSDRTSSNSLDLKQNSVLRLLTRIIKEVLQTHVHSYSTDKSRITDIPESIAEKPRKESLLKPKNPSDKNPIFNPVFLDTDKRGDRQKANKGERNREHLSKVTIDFLRNFLEFSREKLVHRYSYKHVFLLLPMQGEYTFVS